MRKLVYSLFLLVVFFSSARAQFINTATLSTTSAFPCDTIDISIVGQHGCLASALTGNSHSIVGTTININVGASIPQICQPVQVIFNTSYQLTNLPAGTYTVITRYNATSGSGVSNTLTIGSASLAEAGNDTALCATSTYQLKADSIAASASGLWSVRSGSATLVNASSYNATANNLSIGRNVFDWSVNDINCNTSDSVVIEVFENPVPPTITMDSFACETTDTLRAQVPSIGKGLWTTNSPGVSIGNRNRAKSPVFFLNQGPNNFTYTVSNGPCQSVSASHVLVHDTVSKPSISTNGSVLTSSSAPSYQWYLDSAEIPGAINQIYQAQSNGAYMVFTSFPGCETGQFSDEIDVAWVGIEAQERSGKFNVYPNPSIGFVQLSGLTPGSTIKVFDARSSEVHEVVVSRETLELDLSHLPGGLYTVHYFSQNRYVRKRLVLQKD